MKKLFVLLCGTVSAMALGPRLPVTLTWTPSPSPECTGYRVYWRMAAGGYADAQRLAAGTNSNVFDLRAFGLTKGRYYVTMTATNAAGAESDMATEVLWDYTNPNKPTNLLIQ